MVYVCGFIEYGKILEKVQDTTKVSYFIADFNPLSLVSYKLVSYQKRA